MLKALLLVIALAGIGETQPRHSVVKSSDSHQRASSATGETRPRHPTVKPKEADKPESDDSESNDYYRPGLLRRIFGRWR